ncbi:hypothetical protein ACH5RR_040796 [Cinchona calisaya]|uniref:Uncharacterized protein n=1 Tax=Cinchona calisaya TaxID=153742 RepID=A0ABD2XXS9_9GENT
MDVLSHMQKEGSTNGILPCKSLIFNSLKMNFSQYFSERDNFGSNVDASNSINITDDVRAFAPNENFTLVARNIGSTAISNFNSKASESGGSDMANKIEPN